MAKTTLKIESLAFTINNQPITINGFEISNEASAQELATSGGFINQLVETIGNVAERFDNDNHIEEIKEIKVKEEPVEVKTKKVSEPVKSIPTSDFCELPTSSWSGGEPKKSFNLTKAWRAIPVPKSMKKADPDKYRWLGEQYPIADSVSVDGGTYGVVYIHIEAMHKKSFIIIRPENVKFEDDIRPEDFADYMDAINIPGDIKEYIQKVIEL